MTARRIILPALVAAVGTTLFAAPAFAQSSPSAFTSGARYDLDRRVVGTIAPDPDGSGPLGYAATRTTFDARGLVTKVEAGELSAWQSDTVAPAAWSGFTIFRTIDSSYDIEGRKVKDVTTAGGAVQSVVQYSYDSLDRLRCTAVRMNPAVFASPPSDACALGTEGSAGPDRITRNSYIGPNWVETIEKAVGTSLQQVYARYSYAATGQIASVIDANGNKATMTYDSQNRQTRWTFPSKTTVGQVDATDYEEYGYDAAGNREAQAAF